MYTIDVYFAAEYGPFAHGAFAASDEGCGSYLCKRRAYRHFETKLSEILRATVKTSPVTFEDFEGRVEYESDVPENVRHLVRISS